MSDAQRRVLYVDDDEGLCALARRALERRGYHVTLAATGEDGFAALQSGGFDVVALDHYMPGQGGFETLLQIRKLQDPPPVVYVTGSEESRVAVSALKAGASDYVVKSVGEAFFDLLDSALEQAFEQVELRRRHAKAEADLVTSNQRLEALLREVNHRVANSLQLVSAFVQMQASAVDGVARSALKDTQLRIEAITQVHRRLYSSGDVESVEMQDYLSALVRELQDTLSSTASPRNLSLVADPVRLATDQAVSLGVIVNELITNACKYAYRRGEPGEVRIRLTDEGAGLTLTVEDDGAGMAPDGAIQGTGLGGRLIKAMAASLNSELLYDPAYTGVRATLRLPAA